ncbi:MAG: CheR family methyltransferase, partial [Pseudomonadota bacterium]
EGMPQAAIDTGVIDFVVSAVDMPQKLIDLWKNAARIQLPPLGDGELIGILPPDAAADAQAEEALLKILALLCNHTGHDFRHYKRATVLRRIERRMQVRGVDTLLAYSGLLEQDAGEYPQLLKDMLIGVTNFFRDREHFETLEREIIPGLFVGKGPDEEVRVWVAACSTGEEAYSMAMLLSEQATQLAKPAPFQIFASDIDESAINTARKGIYPSSIISDVTPGRLRHFFTRHEEYYEIRKVIRDRVLFAAHNLLRDPPFSKLDLISCRNLLIYLNRNVQEQVLEMFHFALKPDGILFLGSSESAESVSEFFVPVDKKKRIYRARPLQRSVRFVAPVIVRSPAPLPATKKAERLLPVTFGEIHQRALMEAGAASVLVDAELNILNMSDRAAHFLRFNAGEPSRSLLALVLPELRLELRTTLYHAQQHGTRVEARHVPLTRGEQQYAVTISAHRFHDDSVANDLLLVQFEEELKPAGDLVAVNAGDQILHRLEAELLRNKLQLQETIQYADTSNEELRATNEELQAMNEELRSATEELETSKEELQSVNEELVTVNFEMRMKVEETGKANDDLNNLIASTDIATLFVDRTLRIKRFTPRASEIFSIIPLDIGRSLLDLTHGLDYDELASDVTTTLETLRTVEREVRRHDGRYYIVRLLPYRTIEDRIDGAVMTFFDITLRREAEERARVGEERMHLVAESTKDYAIITLNIDGMITSWNRGAERVFGYKEDEIIGKSGALIFLPEDRTAGVPEDEMLRATRDGRAEDERWHVHKDGSRIYCSGVMTPLRDGQFHGYAKIARDQTARIQLEGQREIAFSHEQLERGNAESSNALKDQFLAIMSHELRQPLNMISLNVELLTRLPAVMALPLAKRATTAIRNSVASQATIIEDLLDLSRVNTGKLTLNIEVLDLAA